MQILKSQYDRESVSGSGLTSNLHVFTVLIFKRKLFCSSFYMGKTSVEICLLYANNMLNHC